MITEEQKKIRKQGIGGSDAAKVCGQSKWGTPLTVFNEKINDKQTKETEAMRIGSALEPMIIKKYEELTGNNVKTGLDILFNKNNKFMLANIDGIVSDKNIIVEAKTAKNKKGWGTPGTCDVPVDYLFQVAHYCSVYEISEAHIIVFFKDSSKYDIFKYYRNDNFENAIIKKEKNFWENHVLKNLPPPATKIKDVRIKYDLSEEKTSFADDETITKYNKLLDILKSKKQIEEQEESLKIDIMLKMGVSSELKDNFGNKLISWKNIENNRFDVSKFKIENPDIYNQYVQKQSMRRFLINQSTGK